MYISHVFLYISALICILFMYIGPHMYSFRVLLYMYVGL